MLAAALTVATLLAHGDMRSATMRRYRAKLRAAGTRRQRAG